MHSWCADNLICDMEILNLGGVLIDAAHTQSLVCIPYRVQDYDNEPLSLYQHCLKVAITFFFNCK